MTMLKDLSAVSFALMLAACGGGGGGGGGDEANTTVVPEDNGQTAPSDNANNEGNIDPDNANSNNDNSANDSNDDEVVIKPDLSGANGIYYDTSSPISLIVDLERENYPVLGMDWENAVFYVLDSAVIEGSTITATGLTGFKRGANNLFEGIRDANRKTTIKLGEDFLASTSVNILTSNYIYDFNSKTYSLTLDELAKNASYLSTDGSEIIIDASGQITVNAAEAAHNCTFSAQLERKGVYFSMKDLNATGCNKDDFKGDYQQGTLITLKDPSGNDNIFALLVKDEQRLAWVSAEIPK